MALLILLFPFAELYTFYLFIQAYSFLDALLLVITSGFLGMTLLMIQGKASLHGLQSSMSQGKAPGNQLLHRAVMMLGALLILIPGILSDIVGVLCILPVSRHLIVFALQRAIARGVGRGQMNFVFANFSRATPSSQRSERDATVVDVTPIEVTHIPQKDPDDKI